MPAQHSFPQVVPPSERLPDSVKAIPFSKIHAVCFLNYAFTAVFEHAVLRIRFAELHIAFL